MSARSKRSVDRSDPFRVRPRTKKDTNRSSRLPIIHNTFTYLVCYGIAEIFLRLIIPHHEVLSLSTTRMSSQFSLDLRLARKKAGYTQDDIAHLLATHQAVVSLLEHGKRTPTLIEIVELSLLYGRSFEGFFAELLDESRARLRVRLATLPNAGRTAMNTFNRPASLDRLKRRLSESDRDAV